MVNQWTKQYQRMVHIMDNLMIPLWGYWSGTDEVLVFGGCAAKTIAGSYVVMAMGK
jgi:hypothetical protein